MLQRFTEPGRRTAVRRQPDATDARGAEAHVRRARPGRDVPRLFGLFYGLGTAFFGASEFGTATQLLATALTIQPHQPQAHIQLRVHYALGQDKQAHALERAVQTGRPSASAVHDRSSTAPTTNSKRCKTSEVSTGPGPALGAWVTLAGLHLLDGDRKGHRSALRRVRVRLPGRPLRRACWLSVRSGAATGSGRGQERYRKQALEALEDALRGS